MTDRIQRCEIFTAVKIKVQVFRAVKPCSDVVRPCYLHFTLKMEATNFSETPVFYRITTRRHNPEGHDLNHLTPSSRVILEKLIVTQQVKKFPAFMEPECSLPCSQEPATGPHPELD